MTFSFYLPAYIWIILSCTFVLMLLGAWVGLRNLRAVARKGKRLMEESGGPDASAEALPSASVIVYAKNAEEYIRPFLEKMLSQDYPDFEVIVVNDASIDNTAEIIDTLQTDEPRLRYSFVPDSSRNVSRRKVALTIGAKAAKGDVLVVCNAHSTIPSLNWLLRMAAPFANKSVEVSVAASHYPTHRQRGAGRWYRQFDSFSRLSQWVGSALSGHPYRGDAYSVAFRRSKFFELNGFAATNRFVAGEDDIFINSFARPENTVTVLHPEAYVERLLPEEEYPRLWLRDKERYAFTQRYLNTGAFRRQALLSWAQWGSLGGVLAASFLGSPNVVPGLIGLVMLLLLWGYEICLYRRGARVLHTTRLFWAVPLFWLARPIINALLRVHFHSDKASNYTWKYPK